MRFGSIRAVAGLALVSFGILGSFSKLALAQMSPAQRFELASPDEKPLRDVSLATQPVTVFLKMAGDPVAVVRSRAPGKQLSEPERRSITASLRQEQDKIAPMIEAMGGTVVAKLQHAINGIKVRATRDQLASMATLPGVVGIKPVLIYKPVNAVSVPFIGAPVVWGGSPAFHGEHIKLAILDTGADYTHANFGGPGTVAAFSDAFANSTKPADPALFGPGAPKVKGGTDLVGDDYDASNPTKNTPHPDPNPLDCNGHGSHVAGTAAGFGVRDDGTTYRGPYDASTPNVKFRIGPGVAPQADVYAVRVFGCTGSTDVVVEAIDWAVEHGMQIISMSLGADFGPEDTADAEASEHAAEAGLIVVAAAGNAGQAPYFLGSPAAGDKTLAAAAMDSTATFPGAVLTLNTGTKLTAQNNNAAALPGRSLPIFVLPDTAKTGAEGVSLGCDENEYDPANITGKLVVALRGVCARVNRAIFGQRHGAAAVALINNDPTFGVFEGDIVDPANGNVVTIPLIGVRGNSQSVLSTDARALIAAASTTLAAADIANPGFKRFAGFTSGGPRNLDSFLKPDVTAPGVSILSTAIGTGNRGERLSGTSMATPHVSGVAALALQSHPDWDADNVRLAIANTADASQLGGFQAKLGGSGLVQPFAATRTSVVARGTKDAGNLSFGVAEFSRDFSGEERIRVQNLGSSTQTFAASVIQGPSTTNPATSLNAPHSVTVSPSSVKLQAGESAEVRVRLNVPAATAGSASGTSGPAGFGAFRQASGLVTFSPTTADGNGGTSLAVPYFLVSRARSEVQTKFASGDFGPTSPSTTAEVRNQSPAVTGTADFYAWGLRGKNRKASTAGLRAVGVQSLNAQDVGLPASVGKILVFAVNVFHPWTTPVLNEYDILLDVNGDGKFDFAVASVGLTTGRVRVNIFDLSKSPPVAVKQTVVFAATAPTNESTILMPIVAADAGVKASSPRFAYAAQGFDGFTGDSDFLGENADGSVAANAGRFNAFSNAVSTGAFAVVGPRSRASVPLTINPTEFAATPALGVMVVGIENFSGRAEANLLRFEREEDED
ncbi:MAG: peptidase S8 and S53 subtilisin kexin sedolisin [Betaproteobacteria bacterium]|nr:MAG: peptidase S8 and S53 subtilisin kexin sedolisin [Betaproteobacteria bacterium]